MNDKDSELIWTKQQLFKCVDEYGVILTLSLSGGISIEEWGNNIQQSRLSLEITDIRINKKSIKIDLLYEHIDLFLIGCEEIKKHGIQEALNKCIQPFVSRTMYKKTVTMACNIVTSNNGFKFAIKISDPTSIMQQEVIHLDTSNFKKLCKLFRNFHEQYISISSSNTMITNQERMITEIKKSSEINSRLMERLIDATELLSQKMGLYQQPIQPNTQVIDMESHEPVVQSDIQNEFFDKFKNTESFDDIPLDGQKKVIQPSEFKPEIPKSFFSGFMKYDINKIKTWTIGYMNSKDMNPLGDILLSSAVSDKHIEDIIGSTNYKDIHESYKLFMKDAVKKLLEGKLDFIKLSTSVPKISLDWDFNEDSELGNITLEIMIIILCSLTLYNNGISKLIGNEELEEQKKDFCQWLFIFRTVCTPLIFSMRIDDEKNLDNKLIAKFRTATEHGIIKSMKDYYSLISQGETYNFSIEVFGNMIPSYIKLLKTSTKLNFDQLTELNLKLGLITSEPVSGSPEAILESGDEPVSTSKDKRLDLYVEIVSKMVPLNEHVPDFGNLKVYSDLDEFLKVESLSDEFYKVKRVMDIYPHVEEEVKLKKLITEFNEEDTVTQSRVIQQDSIEGVEDFSDEFNADILSQF